MTPKIDILLHNEHSGDAVGRPDARDEPTRDALPAAADN
jgi:hypothetical protein